MNESTKSKLKLTALLLMVAVPVTLASLTFRSAFNGGWGGTANNGTLISPPADIEALDMRDTEGELLFRTFEEEIEGISPDDYQPRPWLMVYVTASDCEQQCRERLYSLRQLHIALGKDIQRVRRYYLHAAAAPLNADDAAHFQDDFPSMGIAYSDAELLTSNLQSAGVDLSLATEDYVLFVDPVGNVMMYYTKEQTPQEIMSDLEHLLKYSSLG